MPAFALCATRCCCPREAASPRGPLGGESSCGPRPEQPWHRCPDGPRGLFISWHACWTHRKGPVACPDRERPVVSRAHSRQGSGALGSTSCCLSRPAARGGRPKPSSRGDNDELSARPDGQPLQGRRFDLRDVRSVWLHRRPAREGASREAIPRDHPRQRVPPRVHRCGHAWALRGQGGGAAEPAGDASSPGHGQLAIFGPRPRTLDGGPPRVPPRRSRPPDRQWTPIGRPACRQVSAPQVPSPTVKSEGRRTRLGTFGSFSAAPCGGARPRGLHRVFGHPPWRQPARAAFAEEGRGGARFSLAV